MSRVAAVAFVGLCFLAGCTETPQPIKVSVSVETKPKTQTPDIIIVTDPNQLMALEDTLENLQPLENQYFIIPVEPQPGVDYKIVAVKPNPNIDYKILNPMQNYDKRHIELLDQKYKDNLNIPQNNVFIVP